MSLSVSIKASSANELNELEAAIGTAAEGLDTRNSGGLQAQFGAALIQLDRFVANNIEVDTGRTKNSIFQQLSGQGNRVLAMLGTNVNYAPWVRNSQHSEQFFKYAERVEAPRVLASLADNVVVRFEDNFKG